MLTQEQFAQYEEKGSMPDLSAKLLYNAQQKKTYIAVRSTLTEPAQKRFVEHFGGVQLFYAKKQDFYQIFAFDELQPLPDQPISEIQFWDVMAGLVELFYNLKRLNFSIRQVKTELLFFRQENLIFASYQNLSETTNETDFQQDVVQLGKIAFKLLFQNQPNLNKQIIKSSEYTLPCKNLLQQLLCEHQNRIQIDELIEHPILKPYCKNTILRAQDFELSDFEVKDEIGHGTFGRVHLAVYIPSGEKVVLKSSNNHKMQQVEIEFLKRAVHPHIVRCYGRFRDNLNDYIILQYCEQGDLFQRMQKGKIDENQAFQWICQLSSALYYLHSINLMHRDIKPQNILLQENQPLITDFGVSKTVEGTTDTIVGTPLYYSPEQYFRRDYGKQADVFALGLVFFNILVNQHPFGSQPKETQRFFDHVQKHGGAQVYCKYIKNEQLRQIVVNMLLFDPRRRFTAGDVCVQPAIHEFLRYHNLPRPHEASILLSTRVISGGFGLFVLFQLLETTEDVIIAKFEQNRAVLRQLFALACRLLHSYVFSFFSTLIQRNAYFNYICNQIGSSCCQKLNQNQFKAQIFDAEQCYTAAGNALRFGQLLQDVTGCAGTSVNVAVAFLAKKQLLVQSKTAILICQRFIVESDGVVSINVKQCASLLVQFRKLKGRIRFCVEGTCEITVCGDFSAGQISGVFTAQKEWHPGVFGQQTGCLIELLYVCHPELFSIGKAGEECGEGGESEQKEDAKADQIVRQWW